ncbi:MAG: hypothetical protein ACRD3E_04350 [Terriglobales bacterium]
MFYLRGILLCASAFVMVYAAASLVIGRWWRRVAGAAGSSSNVLFALRMVPAVAAAIAVTAFVLPSFLRFEPRVAEETIGWIPLLLSTTFVFLTIAGASRVWLALRRTRECVRQWTSRAVADFIPGAVLVDSPLAPPVVLAGISKSTLVISAAAQSVLTQPELERAIAHEISHRRASDNLKKLLLRAFEFPGMTGLEQAWREAIELSADSKAVHSEADALDLASALVKIARLQRAELPELASGLVDGPQSGLQLRIERLLHWRVEQRQSVVSQGRLQFSAAIALIAVLCACPGLLRGVHIVTELLMR